jgi:ubiquinol-cytochrome c reductase cytochrome c subunit
MRLTPRLVTLCYVLLAVGAAAPPAGAQEGREPRAIYGQECAWCHGGNGEGSARGPGLQGVGAASAHFWLSTGRMPIDEPRAAERGAPRYTDDEIDGLVRIVAGFGPGPPVPEVDLDEADVARGGELYRTHCAACHGFSGWGGAMVFRRNPASLEPATATQIVEAMLIDLPGMPVFGEASFTDEDRRDVAAYVVEVLQEPDRDRGGHALGGAGRVPEGIVAWLVGLAVLVLVAWRLGERRPPAEGG